MTHDEADDSPRTVYQYAQAHDQSTVYQVSGDLHITQGTPPTPAPARNTLLRDVRCFTGRDQELTGLIAEVTEAIGPACDCQDGRHLPGCPQADSAVVVRAIDGMPGVGKTAFATRAAHTLAPWFPDGQLHIPLHAHTSGVRPAAPARVLGDLLLGDGVDPAHLPAGQDARAALWRDRTAGRRMLIVLDDASGSRQIEPLLPASGTCAVLITSRRRLVELDDARHLSLDVLPPQQGVALFAQVARLPGQDPDRELATLVELCGHLPLAIVLLAGRIRNGPRTTLAQMIASMTETRDRLSHLRAGDRAVAAAFRLSYRNLAALPEAQVLLGRMGLHPGTEVDGYAAAALDDTTLDESEGRLQALYDHHLIDETDLPGRFRMHDLVRQYTRRLVQRDPRTDRSRAGGRLLDYYQHTAGLADARLSRVPSRPPRPVARPPTAVPPVVDRGHALAWLRVESANLGACIDHADERHDRPRVVALTAAIAALLRQVGPWDIAVERHTAAAGAARGDGDQPGEASALNQLGIACRLAGDFTGAVAALEQALGISRLARDRLGEANALHSLGCVRQAQADYPRATEDFERALDIYRDLGNRLGEANTLNELGAVRYLVDDYAGSIDLLEQALASYRALGDQHGEANALNYLGAARRLAEDYAGAAEALHRAAQMYESLGDRRGKANALGLLGFVHRLTGRYPDAVAAFEAALRVYPAIGDQRGEANALNLLGQARCLMGDLAGAGAALTRGLDLCRRLGSRLGEANALNYLGVLRRLTGDHQRADRDLIDALEIYRSIGSRLGEANVSRDLAVLRIAAGDHATAERLLREALDSYLDLGDRVGQAEVLGHTGALRLAQSRVADAISAYRQSLDLAVQTGNRLAEAHGTEGLARCAQQANDPDADGLLRAALELYQRLGVRSGPSA